MWRWECSCCVGVLLWKWECPGQKCFNGNGRCIYVLRESPVVWECFYVDGSVFVVAGVMECPCSYESGNSTPAAMGVSRLVSWCFAPSKPQRIISWLKRNFNPSRSYSFHKS